MSLNNFAQDATELFRRLWMQDKNFKEQLLDLVDELKKQDFKFDEDVAVFKLKIDEQPDLTFELAIYSEEASESEDGEQLEFEFE